MKLIPELKPLLKAGLNLKGEDFGPFYEMMTAPTTKILDKWFESEPLKATLATDACIGAMISPNTPGSGYVLLHHVMGELEGVKGAWGYPEGGMGGVSNAIAKSAIESGTEVVVNAQVEEILNEIPWLTGILHELKTESLKYEQLKTIQAHLKDLYKIPESVKLTVNLIEGVAVALTQNAP